MLLDLSPKKRDRIAFGNGAFIAERIVEQKESEPSLNEKRGSSYQGCKQA